MTTQRRRLRERQEIREKILGAARELFATRGIEATTMRAIAQRIQYTPTAIYHHFSDKETLILELVHADFRALAQAFMRIGRTDDPIERLRRIGMAYVDFALEFPHHYRLMFMTTTPYGRPSVAVQGNPEQDAYTSLRLTVAEGLAAGRYREEFGDAEQLAQMTWAAVHGVVSLQLAKQADPWIDWRDVRETAELTMDVLLRGLLRETAVAHERGVAGRQPAEHARRSARRDEEQTVSGVALHATEGSGMRRRVCGPAGRSAVVAVMGVLWAAVAAPAAAQTGPLDGYIAEAIRNNLGLAQERFSDARAEAAVAEARSHFLPSLTVNARYSEAGGVLNLGDLVNPAYRALNDLTGSSGFPTNVDVQLPYRQETTLRIVQPLFNPAIAEQYRLAQRLSGVHREQYGSAARRLAADVQLAWLDHARATRLVELYDRTLPLLDENVRVSERLLAAGTVTPDALFRARAERSEVAQEQAEAVHLRDAARQYFNLLLDRPFDEPIEVLSAASLVPAAPVTLEAALASARQNREELRQAELGIDIADSQRRLAGSGWLPTVALALDYGIQGNEYRLRRDSDFGVASLVLQWHAFNGGRDVSRQRQAALDRDRAGARRVEAERQIALQVETAHRALAVATQGLATAEDRVTAARRTFELVSRRYEQGMAAQVEFLDARVAYTRAELNQILTAYDRAARWVDLEFASALRQPHTSIR